MSEYTRTSGVPLHPETTTQNENATETWVQWELLEGDTDGDIETITESVGDGIHGLTLAQLREANASFKRLANETKHAIDSEERRMFRDNYVEFAYRTLREVALGTCKVDARKLFNVGDPEWHEDGTVFLVCPSFVWADPKPTYEMVISDCMEWREYADAEDEVRHCLNHSMLRRRLPAIDDEDAWAEVKRGLVKYSPQSN